MSDDNTPDVTVQDDTTAAVVPEAPAAAARAGRGRSRSSMGSTPEEPTADDAAAAVGAPAPTTEADTGAGLVQPDHGTAGDVDRVQEPSISAREFEAITADLKNAELFDSEEVANAPRPAHPLKPVVEALIFASPEPLTVKAMGRLLDDQPREDIEAALAQLRESYLRSDGLQLVEVAGGFQIVTRPELYEWVRRLFKERTTSKLSVQALETLAVIAYKQPVTSGEIAEIRGVSATTGVLNTLLDRKLVKIVGRKQVVGRPFMYGTTREFLDKFGLKDLSDLPKVEDMSEALGFDLPSRVGEGEGVSLPFDDARPVEPLLFQEQDLRVPEPSGASDMAAAPPASSDAADEPSRDADAVAAPDAPDDRD